MGLLGERDSSADNGHDSELPRNKRQRTAVACDSCRNRKSRCDGTRPSCIACVEMGFECVYRQPSSISAQPAAYPPAYPPAQAPGQASAQDPSRFSQVEGRLQMLEVLLLQIVRGSHGNPGTAVAGSSHSGADSGLSPFLSDATANHMGPMQSADGQPDPSAEQDSVDGMATVAFADETVFHSFGPSSNSAFAAHILRAAKAIRRSSGNLSDQVPFPAADRLGAAAGKAAEVHNVAHAGGGGTSMSTSMLSRPCSPPEPLERQPQKALNPFYLPPNDEILKLIYSYSAHTGRFFPIIDKSEVVRSVKELDRSTAPNLPRPRLCLLNAVMACGTNLALTSSQDFKVDQARAVAYLERAFALLTWPTINSTSLETGLCLLTDLRLNKTLTGISPSPCNNDTVRRRHVRLCTDMAPARTVDTGCFGYWPSCGRSW